MPYSDSFYRKDNWLQNDNFEAVIKPDTIIFQKLYTLHFEKVKFYISRYDNISTIDAHDIAFKTIIVFTLNYQSGKFQESTSEKSGNYAKNIAYKQLHKYWSKNNIQKQDILDLTDYENNETFNSWYLDNKYQENKEVINQKLLYLEDCKEEYLNGDKEHIKINLDILLSKYRFGLKNKELAEMNNTSEGGIKKRNHATYSLLRDCIERKLKENPDTRFM